MENALRRVLTLLIKAAIFLPFCSICVWSAYSMGAQIHGGVYTYSEAVRLAIQMSLLTVGLTATVSSSDQNPSFKGQAMLITWPPPAARNAVWVSMRRRSASCMSAA
jgi:hypothetical protein